MKKKEKPPDELFEQKKQQEADIETLKVKLVELAAARDNTIGQIGNLVPDDVPVDDDEDHNLVVDTNGVFEREDWMLSHYDLITMAGSARAASPARPDPFFPAFTMPLRARAPLDARHACASM